MRAPVPLVVLAMAERGDAPPLAILEELRAESATVYATYGMGGCLRAATSLGPDVIYLDPSLPPRVSRLLQAHPRTRQASLRIMER